MRRLLVLFLMVIFPLQSVWAAVGSLCQHEAGRTAQQHLGHHAHQHQQAAGIGADVASQVMADAAFAACPHDKAGHGSHGHDGTPADHAAAGTGHASGTASGNGFDGDCGTCHLSCLSLVLLPPPLPALGTGSTPPPRVVPAFFSAVPDGPERPNWAPAV